MTEPQNCRWPRALVALESVALFALGAAILTFLYARSVDNPGDEIGVPEHDSFYHIKMALIWLERGLVDSLPWLEFVYFRQEGREFVNHHYGFQVLLAPFVWLSQTISGDPLPGGRWAIAAFFGLNLLLFNLILRHARVPFRWAWVVLFLLLPDQFFGRHAFIRAIGPSLAVMQLVLLFLLQERWAAAGLAIAAYVHVYLGAVTYAPVIVAAFALARVLGPGPGPRWPAAMVGWCAGGWMLGVVLHPYARGMLEFLTLQVFGSGLAPDIEVGLEWRPYTDAWFLVRMSAVTLAVWVIALVVRVRRGPALDAQETALLIVQFAFLLLTLKARRFIEYWPYMALLCAALLLRPALDALRIRAAGAWERRDVRLRTVAVAAGGVIGLALTAWALSRSPMQPTALQVLAEWRLWAFVLALAALAPLIAVWMRQPAATARDGALLQILGVPASGALLLGGCVALLYASQLLSQLQPPRLAPPAWAWAALAAAYVAGPALGSAWRRSSPAPSLASRARAGGAIAVGLVILFGGMMAAAGDKFGRLARDQRCFYDLAEIRTMMSFVRAHAQPDDIIFTDDWDIFPVFFYVNSYNRYVVGLDPKFTQERRPDLWARYVRITRGETPARASVLTPTGDGRPTEQSIDINLADIREHFNARWVIVDRDHRRFALKLLDAPDVAQLVYPERDFAACSSAPYWVFRVRPAGEAPIEEAAQPDAAGNLLLSRLRPTSHSQGFGDLRSDATVDGRTMQMRGLSYGRGVGMHAPSISVYAIPDGYDVFEALVGVDDETEGEGSFVASVHLDGRKAFETPVLTGRSPPATIRLPLGGARQLMLRTDPTADGQRFDHVNWADARLVRAAPASQASP